MTKKTGKKTPQKKVESPEIQVAAPAPAELGELCKENYRDHLAALHDDMTAIDAEIGKLRDERQAISNQGSAIMEKYGPATNTPQEEIELHKAAVAAEQERRTKLAASRGVTPSKLDQVLAASNKSNTRKVPPRIAQAQADATAK